MSYHISQIINNLPKSIAVVNQSSSPNGRDSRIYTVGEASDQMPFWTIRRMSFPRLDGLRAGVSPMVAPLVPRSGPATARM